MFLPRKDAGEALCSKEIFEWVKVAAGVSWARSAEGSDTRRQGRERQVANGSRQGLPVLLRPTRSASICSLAR